MDNREKMNILKEYENYENIEEMVINMECSRGIKKEKFIKLRSRFKCNNLVKECYNKEKREVVN